ncbi:MAG: ABC transporter ATP-binding protein [Armatimonadota bacterium]
MESPLVTKNLTKVYNLGRKKGKKLAVDNLNIEVPEGVIFGFLGPNGAGKTSTIKMLLQLLEPTSGSAYIFGKSISEASTRLMIGYLPEQPYFHKFLKPIEIVSMHAALAGVKRKDIKEKALKALQRAKIDEYANIPLSKLSKGLTQRVGIAQAIVADPKLLILDEPTSGLDPIGRRYTRELLVELRNEGKTIILSSHILSEIENICDYVAVLKNGQLAAFDKPNNICKQDAMVNIQISKIDDITAQSLAIVQAEVHKFSDYDIVLANINQIYETMKILENNNIKILRIETTKETLEEAFLRLAA